MRRRRKNCGVCGGLYGRRATILTPEREALGVAPTAQNNLLGS